MSMWGNSFQLCLVMVLVCAGCGLEHDHLGDDHGVGEDGATTHTVRDVAAQPCTPETWAALVPDLRSCELAGLSLGAVNLRRVNLSDSTLENAFLERADLFKASLVNANLRGADLRGVNLTGADLTAADLTNADLRGATLANAVLGGGSLTGALTDSTTVCATGAAGPCW
jgi:uncharacterized protein YjbI with pentapeptide repeats